MFKSFKTRTEIKDNNKIKSIERIFPEDMRTNKIKNEIYKIKKWDEKIQREDLKYKTIFSNIIFW